MLYRLSCERIGLAAVPDLSHGFHCFRAYIISAAKFYSVCKLSCNYSSDTKLVANVLNHHLHCRFQYFIDVAVL